MEDLKSLKPKLSSEVQIKFLKRDERGDFYIIGIKGKKDFLRIHTVGKEIVEMMNGETSVAEIEQALKKKETEVDLTEFVLLLAKKGFLENVPCPKGKRKNANTLLIHYIPVFKRAETIVKKIHSIFHGFFRRELFIASIVANFIAFSVFVFSILSGLINISELFFLRNSLVWAITLYIIVITPILIAIHEFSHALACYHYGGKPQEMGVALLVFLPFFYSDTSDTWMFSKRQAIMVFLAGPLSTFFIGNFCVLLSFGLPQPYSGLFRMVAFGSYLAVLVGFNPLIESDGYFILQTLTDFPNLITHARKYIPLWFKSKLRHLSSEDKEQMESYSRQERKILALYAPSAFLISAAFIVIMGYWGILFAIEYARIVATFKDTFPNVAVPTAIDLGMQTVYLALMVLFLVSTVRKLWVSAKQSMPIKLYSSETDNNKK